MSAILLIAPFDCLGITGVTREAADCCAKGKCLPTENADSCCRQTVPGGHDFVKVSTPTPVHAPAVLYTVPVERCFMPTPDRGFIRWFEMAWSPPGSPPGSGLNLPLLI